MLQCRNETQSCFSNLVYCIDHFVLFGPCFFAHCPTEYHREAGRLYAAMRIMAGHSDALTGFWQSVIAFLLQLFWAEFLAKAICFPSIFIPCFFNGKPPPTNKQTNKPGNSFMWQAWCHFARTPLFCTEWHIKWNSLALEQPSTAVLSLLSPWYIPF